MGSLFRTAWSFSQLVNWHLQTAVNENTLLSYQSLQNCYSPTINLERSVNQAELYSIDEAVVIFIVWIYHCLSVLNPPRKRNPPNSCLHCVCQINVYSKLKDVVQDVGAVSVVVLIQELPLNGGNEQAECFQVDLHELPDNNLLQDSVNEHDLMLCDWWHLQILNAWVILGEDCFHFNPNLESRMSVLLIPQVNALEYGLGKLLLHMIEWEVTMHRLVFCAIHIPVSLHCSTERIYNGNGTFVLNHICFFLCMSRTHVNVHSKSVIYEGVWLWNVKSRVSRICGVTNQSKLLAGKGEGVGWRIYGGYEVYGYFSKLKN